MLPEIGASELLVIAVVALIVVGPKDLPQLLRRIGQFMAKLRSMASEFRASFDDMARQSELDDLRREVEAMRNAAATDFGGGEAVAEIEQSMADLGVQLHPPMSYQFSATDAPPPELEAPKPARKRSASTAAKPKATAKAKAPTGPKAAVAKPKPAAKPKAKPIVEAGK
jgi:sec-independent protein translocase protein TatB